MKPLKFKKITGCQSCPCCNQDNEYGYNWCNLGDFGPKGKGNFVQMPKTVIHKDCPMRDYVVTLFPYIKKPKK